jgi:MFS family permease
VAGTFVPLLPQIAVDLNTTTAVVRCVIDSDFCLDSDSFLKPSLTVSIAVFATSVGSLLGSSYSTFCTRIYLSVSRSLFDRSATDGRRPVYLIGIPVLFISTIGVANSQSTSQLLFWRFCQAMGSSPGLTIGSAVIGDIYKLEERGTALGIFYAVRLLPCQFRELLNFPC